MKERFEAGEGKWRKDFTSWFHKWLHIYLFVSLIHIGTQLIFKDEDIGEAVTHALSSSEVLTDMHTTALQLLVAATTVLDSAVFLQAALGYQVRIYPWPSKTIWQLIDQIKRFYICHI